MQKVSLLLRSFSGARISGLFSRLILAPFFLVSLVNSTNAVCREVIVHYKLSAWEDGNPQRDADGVKNGIVVWKSGAVHVVNGSYSVEPGTGQTQATLIAEPDAIIKMADEFIVDDHGKLVSWKPPLYGAHIESRSTAALKFDGVTITSIEDDAVGGDTNEDSAKSSPQQGSIICMSGNDKDVIQNCTIKYCAKLGGIGSSKLLNNHFIDFGKIESSSTFPGYSGEVVFNAVPTISGNTFEGPHLSLLDFTGLSPVIEHNTIRGASTAILVGPRFRYGSFADDLCGPISGTTVITGNTIENCDFGIMVYDSPYYRDVLAARTPPFSLSIRNNKFIGKGSVGISVGFSNKAEIVDNQFDNIQNPIAVQHDYRYDQFNGDALKGLVINHNTMTRSAGNGAIDSISYKYWSKGIFVDARYNDWGDPSGPLDLSNKDGLSNPFGKGVGARNGINYRNFIGAGTDVIPDAIRISATSDPIAPLPPKSNASMRVNVEAYQLTSSLTGKITVMVKDETGMILNGSGTMMDVTSQGHTLAVAPIQVAIPEYAGQIRVEASLAPDANNAVTVFSNPILFTVDQPQSAFQLTSIKDLATGKHPNLLKGTKVTLKFDFMYVLAGALNGKFEIVLKDRVTGSATTLQDYPSSSLELTPGSNQTASINIDVPLGDHSLTMKEGEQNELYYAITMKDAGGKTAGTRCGALPIRALKNFVHVSMADPMVQKDNRAIAPGSTYFPAGEVPALGVSVCYQIETPDVTNWQIQVGPLDVVDNFGKTIYSYLPSTIHWKNLTTTGNLPNELFPAILMMQPGAPVIPAGASKIRIHVHLIDPNKNSIVYTEHSYEIPVRTASQTVEKDIAQGPSQVSFGPIPVKLSFASNTSATKVTANEFAAPYRSGSVAKSMAGITSAGYTSLKRYWSVFDTLKDGSYSAQLSITYDPARDFPSAALNEDSLVMTSVNPNNGQLEALPSTLDKSTHTITTDYYGFYELYVIAAKTGSLTGISTLNAVPGQFALMQNYPNPCNSSTVIKYSLPEFTHVRLKLHDVLGRPKAMVIDKQQPAGEYQIQFDASSLPSGVYIITIEAGQFRESKKLLLLK